ncbi:LIC_11959 family protein [Leptospira sp. 'Mane']|uniref:LIC_11959 family protein n=1 Tax=Leptospira sp. 'Mane' TaxID=3387407 RepID=UPI00398AC576
MNRILFFYIFLSFVFPIFAEEGKYTGAISLSEKRILQAKEEWLKTNDFPAEWKLYYKGKEGDFVVFYDWNGHEIHYQYRRNKFDLDGETFVKDLFPGNPYRVTGVWTGYYYFGFDARGKRKAFHEKKILPANREEFADVHTIPVFKLIKYEEIFSDELLY